MEGIFRLSGSERRIRELKTAFDTPDRYGKGLDWTNYTVHDAANILRRYFNQLPEPIIPLEFYDRFRDPIRNHQSQAVGPMDGQKPHEGDFSADVAIKTYQKLITELPPLNRQLLLYILDLLAVFASKSDLNKMTTPNLAAIFQPGILSHPQHAMAPEEYRLSQDVLIFLIENQDHFLIGMQGTAADEKTVQEVESGPPTPSNRASTPRHSKSTIVRTGSNSSRYSGVRRSVSASSRRSRNSVTASPISPELHSPLSGSVYAGSTSGVHRSNTLPTRSPNLASDRFYNTTESGKTTPDTIKRGESPLGPSSSTPQPEERISTQGVMTEMMTPNKEQAPLLPMASLPRVDPIAQNGKIMETAQRQEKPEGLVIDKNPHLNPASAATSPQSTPTSTSKGISALWASRAPSGEQRKPNKLQKKRVSGSANPSAASSTQSLENVGGDAVGPIL